MNVYNTLAHTTHTMYTHTTHIGFDPNDQLSNGWTGLMCACDIASLAMVELLLKRGSSPNAHKGNHVTPPFWCMGMGPLWYMGM